MASDKSYLEKLWGRVPWIFALIGLGLLGFGRKAQRFQEAGGNLPPKSIGITLVVIGVLLFGFQMYRRRSRSSGGNEMSQSSMESSDDFEPAFDFTNEEVQELVRNDDELDIESWVDDDLARLVSDGGTESHYAVLDLWWNQIADGLGYESPEDEDDFGEYIETIAHTSAYEDYDERVGEYPDIENNICGTSPFVVEH